jgi:hypothetical protein
MAEERKFGVWYADNVSSGWQLDGRNQPRTFTKGEAERYVALLNRTAHTGTYSVRALDANQ